MKLEKPEEAVSAFGDYLSEMYSWLKHSGFEVHMNMPEWKPVFVRINIDFIGRIVNNILSNMEKYADREKTVELGVIYNENSIRIYIQNAVSPSRNQVKGTGMGMKNIAFMMEQMMGSVHVSDTEQHYRLELEFPVTDK